MLISVLGVSMDPLLIVSAAIVGGFLLWLLYRYCRGGWCYSQVRLDGKTVVITGANTGIGKETARDMARRGARVILACRDVAKGKAAAMEICKDTGNSSLAVYRLDLASLASVRECAQTIRAEEARLDVLINNAGIMMCPQWTTEDGFEMQLGVNHLGHFLLTNLLLDLLRASAPSRIVIVSSLAHEFGKMHWDDLQMSRNYHPIFTYSQSKLANVLFMKELSSRLEGSGVGVFALHPGNVMTELTRYTRQALGLVGLLFSMSTLWPSRLVLKSATEGAQTSIHCAVAEELEGKTGIYFSDCAARKPHKLVEEKEALRRLWELSAEMVGLEKKVD